MKKNIKSGIQKLPLLYQISETVEISNSQGSQIAVPVRPNRLIKMKVYEAVKTTTNSSPKPITKSFNFW